MLNLIPEDALTLAQAAQALPRRPNGKAVHVNTVRKWIRHGVQGVCLESYRVGGRVFTTIAALQRFHDVLTSH